MTSPVFDSDRIAALVKSYVSSEESNASSNTLALVEGLLNGTTQSIRDFVEALGPFLTSTDADLRTKGMPTDIEQSLYFCCSRFNEIFC